MVESLVPLVSYATVRPLLRSGDLLLCQGSTTFARLIQHATDSPWSHVACLIRMDALERILVLESVESIGCRAVPLSHYIENYAGTGEGYPGRIFIARHDAFLEDMQPVAYRLFAQRAVDLLGVAYDNQAILRIAARVVAAKLGFHPTPLAHDTALICSEFVYEIYQAFGIIVPYGSGGYIAPKDWAEATDVTLLWEVVTQGSATESPCG